MGNRRKKIRIMHVAQAAGGVDRYLRCLIQYLDHKKFENILVCSQDFKAKDYDGIADRFETVEMQRSIGAYDLAAAFTVRKLIKKYTPDIVYAHSSKAGAIVRIANMGIQNKCVYNPHGWAFNMQGSLKKQTAYAVMEKVMAPFADRIVCISEAEKQSALDKKICSEKKLNVIFNGVDVKEYNESGHDAVSRSELDIPEDVFVVGMVGRLSEQKAPDMFVRMAKRIREQVQNTHFIIVGDGHMREQIEKYAKINDFQDALHITGWVSNPLSYVELFDIGVLLSRWEGFGLAIPEYMMCKKPVVATAVDAIPNLITDHKNGLLVPVDDPDAACKAIMELYKDLNLRNKLIAQGIKDVSEKFDARRVSEEHGRLFERLIKSVR